MSRINVYREQTVPATSVPNIFIDEYMARANGDYVKVYLYLLRNLNSSEMEFSLPQMADYFECTERDVVRALKYWEKMRLLRLEFDREQNLSGICFLSDAFYRKTQDDKPVNAADRFIQAVSGDGQTASETTPDPVVVRRKSYTMDDIKRFCQSDDVQEMVFITEQYLGRTLNQNDLNTIFFWYDELHFSAELIEYLIEHCVSRGHKSFHYMERVAEDLAMRSVDSVEAAKEIFRRDNAYYQAIVQAFGIKGRNLVPAELSFIKTWSQEMGFSVELVAEACNRTMRATHEPKFGYANSILESWQKQSIKTLDDVKKADEVFAQSQKGKAKGAAAGNGNNRFLNFDQRDNDYQELQRQLVLKSMQ